MKIPEKEQIPFPQDQHLPVTKKVVGMMLLEAGFEFAAIIAVPLILFIYFGRKLDARFHTKYIVLVGILLATAFSAFAIWKRIKEYRKLLK